MAKKKTNIELLDEGDLGDIRQRLGANDEDDDSFDAAINGMTAEDLCATKSGWELGDELWAESYIYLYRRLVADGVKTSKIERD